MELLLKGHDILTIDGDQRGLQLFCGSGRLWVTQQGDSRDYLLGPDQSHTVSCRGRVVIFALSPATLQTRTATRLAPAGGGWTLRLDAVRG
jgi:hypothetical protein